MPDPIERQLAGMGFAIDPLDPGKLIRLDQATARRPEESWTTEQLQGYAVAGVRRSKTLLDEARKLRVQIQGLVRESAYERWWTGFSLHIVQGRLKDENEWTGWQRQEHLSRTTVWRTIRLYEAYPDPEIIKKLPITEVYRALKLCPPRKKPAIEEDLDEEDSAPITIKHGGRTIIANSLNEVVRAAKAITHLPKSCKGRTIDIITAERRARRNVRRKEIEGRIILPLSDDDIRIHHCRFQDLETVAGIEPASVSLVFPDIPYNGDFLPQVSELAAMASRILVDGGLFVMYSGQFYLPEVLRRLGEHLTWRWMRASVWDGDGNLIHPIDATSQWKPMVVFSKGQWKKRGRWPDVSRVTRKEKDRHEWQQPLEEVEEVVRYFSQPEDLVVDPCGGAFTTAVACYHLGRRCISCDCDESCVADGQQWLAEETARAAISAPGGYIPK